MATVIARESAASELTIELEPGQLYDAGRADDSETSQATLDLGSKKIAIVMSSQAAEGAERPMIEVRVRVEP